MRPAPSGFRRWRTKCSSGRLSCCWNRSTSRTSMTARMGFGRVDRRTTRWETLEADHVERGELSLGGRYPQVFRHAGSCPSADISPTTDTRRCGAAIDREMAQRGRDGGRGGDASGGRKSAGRGGHASNNLAKLPFLFETTVPRARLRPKYGQGFGRKSGREKANRVTPGRKGGCDDGSHRDPEQTDGQGGAGV